MEMKVLARIANQDPMNHPSKRFIRAVVRGEAAEVLQSCQDYDKEVFGEYWERSLIRAVKNGHLDVVQILIAAGANVNVVDSDRRTALDHAICFDRPDIVRALLDHGADVSAGRRTLIGALGSSIPPERQLEYVKLLVEHGIDINELHTLYGDENVKFTAMDWTSNPSILDYLRKHGGRTRKEMQ